VPDAPTASRAKVVAKMHTSIHSGHTEIARHSRTRMVYGLCALSPVS
jgi:hypothetical protein